MQHRGETLIQVDNFFLLTNVFRALTFNVIIVMVDLILLHMSGTYSSRYLAA